MRTTYDEIPDFGALYDSVPIYAARRDVAFYVEEGVAARGPALELGCGTGRVLLPTARAGVEVVGLDSSAQSSSAVTPRSWMSPTLFAGGSP